MPGAIQPDLELAASLFDALSGATRRGRGIVRDSYGAGEQAAHDIMRGAAQSISCGAARGTRRRGAGGSVAIVEHTRSER